MPQAEVDNAASCLLSHCYKEIVETRFEIGPLHPPVTGERCIKVHLATELSFIMLLLPATAEEGCSLALMHNNGRITNLLLS